MRLKTRPRAAGPSQSDRAVARVRQEMRRAIRSQGPNSLVLAAEVLELLDSTDGPEPVTVHRAPDPRADPMTGCMPVTAEGPG